MQSKSDPPINRFLKGALAIVIGIGVVAYFLSDKMAYVDLIRSGQKAPGIVTGVQEHYNRRGDYFTVDLSYKLHRDQQMSTFTTDSDLHFTKGQQVTVLYKPDNGMSPQIDTLAEMMARVTYSWQTLVFGLLLIAAGGYCIFTGISIVRGYQPYDSEPSPLPTLNDSPLRTPELRASAEPRKDYWNSIDPEG